MRPSYNGYVGCRFCPELKLVQDAIRRARKAVRETDRLDPGHRLPESAIPTFNRAVLYLIWYQGFALAARAIHNPYIPSAKVSQYKGVVSFADKDDGSGHKARLGWMPEDLHIYMVQEEAWLRQVDRTHRLKEPDGSPVFFLTHNFRPVSVRPGIIEEVSRDIYPFPANTQRKVMRFMLHNAGVSPEMIEMYLGHWHERREPWGRWSSFDNQSYLAELRNVIPGILKELGFKHIRRGSRPE